MSQTRRHCRAQGICLKDAGECVHIHTHARRPPGQDQVRTQNKRDTIRQTDTSAHYEMHIRAYIQSQNKRTEGRNHNAEAATQDHTGSSGDQLVWVREHISTCLQASRAKRSPSCEKLTFMQLRRYPLNFFLGRCRRTTKSFRLFRRRRCNEQCTKDFQERFPTTDSPGRKHRIIPDLLFVLATPIFQIDMPGTDFLVCWMDPCLCPAKNAVSRLTLLFFRDVCCQNRPRSKSPVA